MGFKKEGTGFSSQSHFTNEMARFVGEEAAFVSNSDNESAAGNVDDTAEKAVRYSAEKNRTAKTDAKIERRQLDEEIKAERVEIKSEKEAFSKQADALNKKREELENRIQNTDMKNMSEVRKQAYQKEFREERAKIKSEERFLEDRSERITEKEVNLSKKVDKKKDAKKKEKGEQKKQASKLSLAKLLQAKKDISNDLAGNVASSGDAFTDGRTGLVGTFIDLINPMTYLRLLLAKLGAAIAPYVLLYTAIIMVVVIIIAILFEVLSPIAEVSDAIQSVVSIFDDAHTFVNTSLSQERINQIVEDSGCDETQEEVLRYALSRVGYPYSQANRTSGSAYDCSSLAYYSWKDAGVDISYGSNYPPSAAEGARMLENDGKYLSAAELMSMKPGDLVYYGGSANGRYKGIFHVAIYVGNGKAVEALNTQYGVVYQNLRTNKAVMVCRPNK